MSDPARTATAFTLALRSFDEDGVFLTIKITGPEPDLAHAMTEKVRELVEAIEEAEIESGTSMLDGLQLGDHEILTSRWEDATQEFDAVAQSVAARVWVG